MWLSVTLLTSMLQTVRTPRLPLTMEKGCAAAVDNTARGVMTRVLVEHVQSQPQQLVSCSTDQFN